MYKALILPFAKQDIAKAVYWYNDKQKGLGQRFIKEIRDKVLFIRENPKAFAVRYDQTRCAVLDVFPFLIHYITDDKMQRVTVVAVFHTSLNPKHWLKR